MSRVFRQHTKKEAIGNHINDTPILIHHHMQQPNTYEVGGSTYKSSCVACLNPTCMKFSPEELKLSDERLNEFPVDANDSVCPMNAIIWERGDQTPSVFAEWCINCGICTRRCPFGAIYSNGNVAVVHAGEPEVVFVAVTTDSIRMHKEQLQSLSSCRHSGKYIKPSEAAINILYTKLYAQKTEARFPNLIVRNLFKVLGNQSIIRRRGDVYFRMDAIVADQSSIGIAEVEFHKDSLEAPRDLLDDIAVLSSRYGINKYQIIPLIVLLELPSVRAEYWRVIKDIRDVLGIRIHSLTLGSLCMMNWSFVDVPISSVDFYADIDSPTIKDSVEKICGKYELSAPNKYAVMEPKK